MHDDIPEALRQPLYDPPARRRPGRWRWWLMAAIAALLVIGLSSLWSLLSAPNPSPPAAVPVAPANPPTPSLSANDGVGADDLLGHFPYAEAPAAELVPIVADGSIQLRQAAAAAYERMAAAAQADGIALAPLSGFRSVADQDYLFFRVKEKRNQDVTQRAEVSAPPGYSEHHTGYALDVGDATQPDTHLSERFAQTAAFAWLETHAARYSFELSFPRGNTQGIAYEPWHWRFVGDTHSLETFYRARELP